jgi:hypothetical protein
MEEGLASLPAQASLPVRPDTGRGACACGASPDSILQAVLVTKHYRHMWAKRSPSRGGWFNPADRLAPVRTVNTRVRGTAPMVLIEIVRVHLHYLMIV